MQTSLVTAQRLTTGQAAEFFLVQPVQFDGLGNRVQHRAAQVCHGDAVHLEAHAAPHGCSALAQLH